MSLVEKNKEALYRPKKEQMCTACLQPMGQFTISALEFTVLTFAVSFHLDYTCKTGEASRHTSCFLRDEETEAQFTVPKIGKLPECPSIDEWIKQLWDIFTMEFYSAIKKKKILHFVRLWIDLENIKLSEISQSEKDKYRDFTHTQHLMNKLN